MRILLLYIFINDSKHIHMYVRACVNVCLCAYLYVDMFYHKKLLTNIKIKKITKY